MHFGHNRSTSSPAPVQAFAKVLYSTHVHVKDRYPCSKIPTVGNNPADIYCTVEPSRISLKVPCEDVRRARRTNVNRG